MKKTVFVLVIVLLSVACGVVIPEPVKEDTPKPIREEKVEWRCRPLPETFQESDLVGTWQSRHGDWATDTITLRENGTYQQTYYSQPDSYYYESPWNRWWVEYRPSGGLYLHLEEMRYCLFTDEVCKREGGGGGDWPYYDPCEDRSIRTMGNEVILTVRGTEGFRYPGIGSVPRGIMLWYMRTSVDTTDHFFVLQG
jgi:hypothetical protein